MFRKKLLTLGLALSLATTSFSGVLSEPVVAEAANPYYDTESARLNPEITEINITEDDCITRDELRYDLIEKYNYDIDEGEYASSIDVNKSSYGGSVVFTVVPSNEGFKFDKYYIKIKPFNMYYDLGKCDDLVASDKDRKVFRFHFTSSDMEYWFGVSRDYNKNNKLSGNTWIYSDNLDISYQECLDNSVVVKEIYNDKTVILTKTNYFDMLSKYNEKEWNWNQRESFFDSSDPNDVVMFHLFEISKGSTVHYYLRYDYEDDYEVFYRVKYLPKKDSFYDYAKFVVNDKIIGVKSTTWLFNKPKGSSESIYEYVYAEEYGYYLQRVFPELELNLGWFCSYKMDFRKQFAADALRGSSRYKAKSLNKKVVTVKWRNPGKNHEHGNTYSLYTFKFKSVGSAKVQFTDIVTGKKYYIKIKVRKKLKKKDYYKYSGNHMRNKSGGTIYGWLK